MSKAKKKSYMAIVIVIILFIIVCLVYDEMKTKPVDANTTNANLADENAGLDNIINELFENVETNDEENEVDAENTKKEDTDKDTEEETKDEEDVSSSESITSKEEKAIALVKKRMGRRRWSVFFK